MLPVVKLHKLKDMETIPKNMVDKVINQIDEIHKKISKIETNQNETVWLDITETAKWLKVSPRTLQNYRDKGMLPFSQVSGKIYFRLQDLQEFLMKHYSSNH